MEALDRHLTQVSRYVETGGREGIGFLIVEMPPRHGKTLTLGRLYPAWHIGRNPDHRMMLVSYGATLAHKSSRAARNLVASQVYGQLYPGTRLAADSKAVDAWNVAGSEGGMDALGVLGGATGKGAHLLICDDLIKNRQEAESKTIRDRTWDALVDDMLTRLEPGGAVILNGTRWHIDDPIGRALRLLQHLNPVRLRLPALAEDDDPLGREPGEALWPERYPRTRLLQIFQSMGPYSSGALYQQHPVPSEGGIFKRAWFEPRISHPPEIVRAVRFWDLAMSAKTSADWTAGVKIGEGVDGHFYVLDVARKQLEWGDVTPFLADVMLADGPLVPQGIEEKGFMSRAVQTLNQDARLRNYQVWGYPKDKDKLTNALPFAAKCAAGIIHVVNAHWTDAWLDEMCSFTGQGEETDDQVDGSAGAWEMIDGVPDDAGEMHYADDTGFSESAW